MADSESEDGVMYGHGGSGPGYNTWAMHLPNFHGRSITLAIFQCLTMLMGWWMIYCG
jgi:D-alanyl-D-alanine carboxypeptidase